VEWKIYRPGDGRGTRWGAWAILVALGLYACYRFFIWGSTMKLGRLGGQEIYVGHVGALVLFVTTLLGASIACFVHTRVSSYLIEVDTEIKKTTWPGIRPWFKRSTEVWGHTYVVLFVVLVMGIFLALVDSAFLWLAQMIWYGQG